MLTVLVIALLLLALKRLDRDDECELVPAQILRWEPEWAQELRAFRYGDAGHSFDPPIRNQPSEPEPPEQD